MSVLCVGTVLLIPWLSLQEREQEILTLKAQLSEFRQPAMAMAGASTAGVTSWGSETEKAAEPVGFSAYSNATWANDWNTAVVESRDSHMAGLQVAPEVASALQSAEASQSRYLWRNNDVAVCNM